MKSLYRQSKGILYSLFRPGESRHLAKINLNRTSIQQSPAEIFSKSTLFNYDQVMKAYCKWLTDVRGVDKNSNFKDTKEYAREYLEYLRDDKALASASVKKSLSALNKVYGLSSAPPEEKIKITGLDVSRKTIKQSRHHVEHDRHYCKANYYEAETIGLAFGLRRSEIAQFRMAQVKELNGLLVYKIEKGQGSKGNRERVCICDPKMRGQVESLLLKMQSEGKAINAPCIKQSTASNPHENRRLYTGNLLAELQRGNEDLRNGMLSIYPEVDISLADRIYKTRDGTHREYNRLDLILVSKSLGHNRVSVIVKHYD